jgi:hypothetical protein
MLHATIFRNVDSGCHSRKFSQSKLHFITQSISVTFGMEFFLFVFIVFALHSLQVVNSTDLLITADNVDGNFPGMAPSCYKGAYRTGVPGDTRVTSASVDAEYDWASTDCAGWTTCPAGSYCGGGKKHSCPPGTYGNSTGLSDRACSGPCPSGYFCTGNTVNPSICGRGNFCPRGSSKPIKVPSGYYSISVAKANTVVADGVVVHISNAHESLLCEPGHYCAAGIRHQCPGGTYGKEPGLTTPSCSGVCSGGYYCPIGSASETECGGFDYFCPEGSGERKHVYFGGGESPTSDDHGAFYTLGGDDNGQTRSFQKRCPAGSFCVGGRRTSCPAGRFGSRLGEKNPLCFGPCKEGYYCPEGSYNERQLSCGGPHHYCPLGSGKPVEASLGYFTEEEENNGGDNGERNTRQLMCDPGHYCVKGERYECPIGRFGSTYGLHTSACSGKCFGGYYCNKASKVPTENDCGGSHLFCPNGTGVPKHVHLGYYTNSGPPHQRSSETRCELGHWCNFTTGVRSGCPAGRYGGVLGLHNDTCSGNCTPGFYCPSASVDSDQERCGNPKYFCPGGTPIRRLVSLGYHSYHGTEPATYYASEPLSSGQQGQKFELKEIPDTRYELHTAEKICPLGSYCVLGLRHLCPAGRYGGVTGLSTSECSGNTTEGYFGPPGSSLATEHECGGTAFFCPSGSGSPYPVSPGHFTWAPGTTLRTTNNTCHENNTVGSFLENATGNLVCSRYRLAWSYYRALAKEGFYEATSAEVIEGVSNFEEPMYLTLYNDAGAEKIRTWQYPCPPGSYCMDGHRWEHPPGRYGRANLSAEVNGTGECAPGYYCPAGSTKAKQNPCGGPNVYCPPGSGHPTPISRGYYTSLGWKIVSNVTHPTTRHLLAPSKGQGGSHIKYEQKRCEVGHYCVSGLRNACPKGRYAEKEGSSSEFCEGPCSNGYFCPHGSYSRKMYECGSPRGLASGGYPPYPESTSVYCPTGMHTGSLIPTRVSDGYYTVGGEHLTNKTRFAQRICPVGHYCPNGRKIRCPSGRYGGVEGLNHINCSGECNPGFFCPQGSWKIDQVQCGNGTRSPCYTLPPGTVASYRPSGERRCERAQPPEYYRWPLLVQEFGQSGPWSRHHQETEFWITSDAGTREVPTEKVHPRQYHYHTTIRHPSRHRVPGEASSAYCPAGTGVPLQVPRGWYTIGGENVTNMTRTGARICDTGYFCEGGKKIRCPPGRYGGSLGMTEAHCSGYCPAGFYCPWNTTAPIECPDGTYSSQGFFRCAPCFQKASRQNQAQTCKTARKCCNT